MAATSEIDLSSELEKTPETLFAISISFSIPARNDLSTLSNLLLSIFPQIKMKKNEARHRERKLCYGGVNLVCASVSTFIARHFRSDNNGDRSTRLYSTIRQCEREEYVTAIVHE